MGYPDEQMEWMAHPSQGAGPGDRIGRFNPRLGSVLPEHKYGWPMVCAGKDQPHQLPRTASCYPGTDNIHEEPNKGDKSCSKIDNTTAVAYINQGGTVSKTLVTLTRDLWMWCLERNIHIQAQHISGVLNYRADTESRTLKDRSDWSLDKDTFSKINERYGPIEVDLFASRLTNQCHRYFSWQPDPYGEATAAILQDWSSIRGFANPPWNMIPQVIMKTQSQKADVILVTPIWKSQPWYAILPSMMVDWPRLLPTQHSALLNPPLAEWSISGNDSTVKAFQAKLQSSSSAHGEQKQTSPMTHSLDTGVADVINGKQIHFQGL